MSNSHKFMAVIVIICGNSNSCREYYCLLAKKGISVSLSVCSNITTCNVIIIIINAIFHKLKFILIAISCASLYFCDLQKLATSPFLVVFIS